MREILFRGKRIDNGEWIEGFYCQTADESNGGAKVKHVIVVPTFLVQKGFLMYEVDPSTIGQYTGLTDKNGKKIFEGDIYAWEDKYGDYCACLICFGEFFEYDDINGFYVKSLLGDIFSFAGSGFSGIEISGNIHDNPEMLKGANK